MEKMIFDETKRPPILGDSYDNEAFVPDFFNEVNYGLDTIQCEPDQEKRG
jgi:hypothetical protein